MRSKDEIEVMLSGLKDDMSQARRWNESAQQGYKSDLSFFGTADRGEVLLSLDLICSLDSQIKIIEWVLGGDLK